MSSNDVVSRLTDPKKYTGAHKARFDEDGKGKGLAGRVDIVEFKGNTNTPTIDTNVSSSATSSDSKKPVVSVSLGKEKFGTQATKSPVITLFRNGDKHHKGELYTVKAVKNMEQLLDKASNLVKLPTGAVRKIYKSNMKTSVKTLEDLVDGEIYLCCGGEKPMEEAKQSAEFLERAKEKMVQKEVAKEAEKEKEK